VSLGHVNLVFHALRTFISRTQAQRPPDIRLNCFQYAVSHGDNLKVILCHITSVSSLMSHELLIRVFHASLETADVNFQFSPVQSVEVFRIKHSRTSAYHPQSNGLTGELINAVVQNVRKGT
jgi:hypothetical protein